MIFSNIESILLIVKQEVMAVRLEQAPRYLFVDQDCAFTEGSCLTPP